MQKWVRFCRTGKTPLLCPFFKVMVMVMMMMMMQPATAMGLVMIMAKFLLALE